MLPVLVAFALLALADLAPLIRRRAGRAAAAFLLLFVPALALALLEVLDVRVPSALKLFGSALRSLGLQYPP